MNSIISLRVIDLSDNEILDASPLETLGEIDRIRIAGNSIDCEGEARLRQAWGDDVLIFGDCKANQSTRQR